jgi:hypothetical protein
MYAKFSKVSDLGNSIIGVVYACSSGRKAMPISQRIGAKMKKAMPMRQTCFKVLLNCFLTQSLESFLFLDTTETKPMDQPPFA